MPSGGKSYSKPPPGGGKKGSRSTSPRKAGTYKRPSTGLPRGTDFQPTKGGGGRGVWKSPSGRALGTSKSEDSPIRKITQRKGKAV